MRRLFAVLVPTASVAFVIVAGVVFGDTWRRAFSMGLWRGDPLLNLETYHDEVSAVQYAYYCDGAGSTVSVVRSAAGGKEQLTLRVNGKAEASTRMDVAPQLLLGDIPMLLRLDA